MSSQAAIGLDIKSVMNSTSRYTASKHFNVLGGYRIDGATIVERLMDGGTYYLVFCFKSI